MAQENKWDIICPITVILDGPTTNHAWSQNMTVFLKGRNLWRYENGSIPKPVPKPKSKATIDANVSKTTVAEDDYEARLEEWESMQSKILSWFINTSVPSIHSLLPRLGTTVIAWIFLSNRYNCTNDSGLEFHIESKLHHLCQETSPIYFWLLFSDFFYVGTTLCCRSFITVS